MTLEPWPTLISNLRTWKRQNTRAVHKPLLTLLLIAKAARGESPQTRYTELATPLKNLLKEFGPPRKSYHPEFPFWHLQSDGFWTVHNADQFPLKKAGSSPTQATLLKHDATGSIREPLWQELTQNPNLRAELTTTILNEYWPETLHPAICQAIGLDPTQSTTTTRTTRKRDPQFRDSILRAYRGECAICSFDGRLAGTPLGIQAAHVKWHAYGGADDISNGLALCNFHHLALDSGALGIDTNRRIIVSCDVTGNNRLDEYLYQFEGHRLRDPQPGLSSLAESNTTWHRKQVFKAPPRAYADWSTGESRAADQGPPSSD